MQRHVVRVVLSLLVCLSPPLALGGDANGPIHLEVEDDPPPFWRARDDRMARSSGLRVTVGSYTSIQANVDQFGQNIVGDAANEPSIAVHPSVPANKVIGWRQFDSISSNFRQAGFAYTFDHGQSWTFPGSLTPGTFRSDPVLDYDSSGAVYYHSLQQSFDVDLFKSTDGGQSWGSPVFGYGGDKNWMVVDRSGGTGDGHVYGTWRAVFGCCGDSIFTRSADAGQSFEFPVEITNSPGIGTMAVGPDGEVYSAGINEFQGNDTFVVSRSDDAKDAGATPTFNGVVVDLDASLSILEGPNPAGLLGQVNVAVDHSDGPSRGNVYVLVSADPNGFGTDPADVIFSRSTDGGATWTPPIRVNDDPPGDGTWHWMGAFSVAPNGRLDAIWNDTRNSGQTNISELFYAYSWDQGDTWSPNIAVSPSFNSWVGWPQQDKIGDYYTIISDATGADVAYSATFNGEQDVYYIRLFPDCNENGESDVVDIVTTSTDCNGNSIPDECEQGVDCGAAGVTPDGKLIGGTQLRLDRSPTGVVTLSWGDSCLLADTDYGVYEGDLSSPGTFDVHSRRRCSTQGQTSTSFLPGDLLDSGYFLVVPQNPSNEGSYGETSDRVERPAGTVVCLPQRIGSCPGVPG